MMNYKDLDYDGLLSDRAIFYYSLFQYVSFLFAIVSFATIVTVIFKVSLIQQNKQIFLGPIK